MTEVKKLLVELYDKTQEAIKVTTKARDAAPEGEGWTHQWILRLLGEVDSSVAHAIDDLDKQDESEVG